MDWKKFKAYSFLGWHFVRHFFKGRASRSSGLTTFLSNYHQDHIFTIDATTRLKMPDFSRCYSCRLCDTACPTLSAPKALAPSYLVASFSRSLTDYALFTDHTFTCESCRQCEEICPQHVPIADIVGFMAKQAQAF